MDEKFAYPYDPERHGHHYGQKACALFAARFALENRNEFATWLTESGIDPADALAWAERMDALHQVAVRGLRDWPSWSIDPMRRGKRSAEASGGSQARRLLRELIGSGDLPLNRRGAAGFRVGGDLWLLSKRVPDVLRAHLIDSGYASVARDKARLVDMLRDDGLLVSNTEGQVVWRMTVEVGGEADTLHLLRVPVTLLWDDPAAAPAEFAGTVKRADQAGVNPVMPSNPVA